MGYRVSYEQADGLLKTWQEQYRVYAPKRFAGRGWRPGTDMIRYGEIQSFRDVAYTEQSHFSPKDVVAPIMQTMLSFTADEVKVSSIDDKGFCWLDRATSTAFNGWTKFFLKMAVRLISITNATAKKSKS